MLVHPDMQLARAILRDRQRAHASLAARSVASSDRPRWRFWRRAGSIRPTQDAAWPIEVRLATACDRVGIDRLAALDERPPPTGAEVLVAEVEGRLWAALDLDSHSFVADPFAPSADAVELLRLRASQLGAARARRSGMSTERNRCGASATVGA